MTSKSERLKQARMAAGFENATEAAERFGWKPPTYLGHENGSRGFSADTAAAYGAAFRVRPAWLLFGTGEPGGASHLPVAQVGFAEQVPDPVLVPVYAVHASAGPGAINETEDIAVKLAFPRGYLRHLTRSATENLAIIGVKGDSMIPTLKDDDVVMLDMTKTDLSYDGLFVIRDGGDALLVKRIGRASRRGYIMIISDNPHVPPVERAQSEIEVIGKVIWRGVKE
jgi:phage repressor protein C with HTH and peptisase S24 domain